VFVQSFPQSPGLSWFQVDRFDALSSVEFLEFSFSGLVDDGQDFSDVFSDNVDLSELGSALGGDFRDFQSGKFLSEIYEFTGQHIFGLVSEGGNSHLWGFLVRHFGGLFKSERVVVHFLNRKCKDGKKYSEMVRK
jgi:hypothetical protein